MTAKRHHNGGERGSALVYILIAIALLAALTISFMEPSSQQAGSQNAFRTASELSTQADFIRSSIQECVLAHPSGDAGALTSGDQKNQPYPLMPDNAYLDGCIATPSAADHNVTSLRCPGSPGDNVCHAAMFGGSTGKFLPPPPPLFTAWQYYAGDDGVFFWTETDKTDPFLDTVLEKMDASYAGCEADIITAAPAADEQMTSDMGTDVQCSGGASGRRCFRVWVIVDKTGGAPVYQEAGCP